MKISTIPRPRNCSGEVCALTFRASNGRRKTVSESVNEMFERAIQNSYAAVQHNLLSPMPMSDPLVAESNVRPVL